MEEALFLDATTQAALVRSGEVSPDELVEQAISRIEKLKPELTPSSSRSSRRHAPRCKLPPRQPVSGHPLPAETSRLVSKGGLTCNSIAGVKASDYRAGHDSFYVERMRDAGFVLIGQMNLPEMGMSLLRQAYRGLRGENLERETISMEKRNVVRSLTRPRIREEKVVRRDMFFDGNGAGPSHPR
jgi:Asp-tRNA(Asn)/Glu-tRNA(Gln) amidotransferase A subunit family amidase